MLGKDNSHNEESVDRVDRTEIIATSVESELKDSFLEYSMSVIVSRALPDVRDGLKPVHRRILYSLYDQGMRPGTPYKKCARVVGDTMGKYHPHGDSAIYDSLVRMAQPFSLRLPLVDGHGNFGSLDDGPAAARYTESRMSNAAMAMTGELSEETVDFKANYDGTEKEPTVLPAGFPNLLVNGTTGIAVGMATNMPSHNLKEVVEGLKAMIENPKITLDQLMKYIPGPDFPSGGIVITGDGVLEAYRTGRGSFRMRSEARIEDISSRKRGIIVTSLPYGVGPEKVIAKIKELIISKRLSGVSDVKDFTDRKRGLRLVIECKAGFSAEAVLDELYRSTPLEESFSVNSVALVNNQPRLLNLLDLCRLYLEHRFDVVTRRTTYRLNKAESRFHIVEGLIKALAQIEEVVALIKSSKDTDTARNKLCTKLDLSEIQASHILEMPLRRLTSLEVNKLKDELKELNLTIKDLKKLLNSRKLMSELISAELDGAVSNLGDDRKSKLVYSVDQYDALGEDEPATVILENNGVFRLNLEDNKFKYCRTRLNTSSRSMIYLFTSLGRLVKIPAVLIPSESKSKLDLSTYFAASPGERVVGVAANNKVITVATAFGMVKRIEVDNLPKSNGGQFITLKENDYVVGVFGAGEEELVALVSSEGQLLLFPNNSVRPQGSTGGGVLGMNLEEGFKVISAFSLTELDSNYIYTTSNLGRCKRSKLSLFPVKSRGGKGVRCQLFRSGESAIIDGFITSSSDVFGIDADGKASLIDLADSRRDGVGEKVSSKVVYFVAKLDN
jgi:DNA gyrase subunit A